LVLAERYNQSLYDLDRTDIESLFPFFFYAADRARQENGEKQPKKKKRVFCDEASWI
jgi:hypothetical protein